MQTIGINPKKKKKKKKKVRNKVNNLIKYAKERFYNNLELSNSDFQKNDRKTFWQVIRHFVKNNNASNNIPPLSELNNGETTYCFSDEEKVECLNNYFTSIRNVDDSNVHLPPFQAKTQNLLSDISCNAGEIETLIKLLNPNKAIGPDAISNRMLTAVAKEISIPLSILFNRSFIEGQFALSWKESNFLPLFKKGDKFLPPNYRSISLLSNIGKLQVRIVYKKHLQSSAW